MPTTNCGAETAANESTMTTRSLVRPRRVAAKMPAESPISSSTTMAPASSCKVAGRRERIKRGDLGLLDVGAAEIALQQVAEVAQILLPERQIEPELAADALDRLGSGAAAGDLPHRIGRHQVEQDVGDQRDADQDEDRLAQPLGDVEQHA